MTVVNEDVFESVETMVLRNPVALPVAVLFLSVDVDVEVAVPSVEDEEDDDVGDEPVEALAVEDSDLK